MTSTTTSRLIILSKTRRHTTTTTTTTTTSNSRVIGTTIGNNNIIHYHYSNGRSIRSCFNLNSTKKCSLQQYSTVNNTCSSTSTSTCTSSCMLNNRRYISIPTKYANTATGTCTSNTKSLNTSFFMQRLCQKKALSANNNNTNIPLLFVGMLGVYHKYQIPVVVCESTLIDTTGTSSIVTTIDEKQIQQTQTTVVATVRKKVAHCWRLLKRFVKLTVTLTPVALLYPLFVLASNNTKKKKKKENESSNNNKKDDNNNKLFTKSKSDTTRDIVNNVMLDNSNSINDTTMNGLIINWYYKICLSCVENSGACIIKLMQWAGSRPDLFGLEFCSIFCKLQDNTIPHSWYHTEQLLIQSYGTHWYNTIQIPNKQQSLLGSGCIGQVYHGRVKVLDNNKKNNTDQWQEVAIKVLHPNVAEEIDIDLQLLHLAVQYMPSLLLPLNNNDYKWLNLHGILNELSKLLQLQINLQYEANNLLKFNKNFHYNKKIKFPSLINGYTPTSTILIEEYCTGIPILQYCRLHYNDHSSNSSTILTDLCKTAIEAVCQMIFIDNFVHGDLHPGNVFVSPDGKQFILLDVGIVNEYNEKDHNVIVDVLAAFIHKDGRLAGRLMIDDSNNTLLATNTKDYAINEELYIDKIEALTVRARTKGHLMEHLGTYITYICNAASQHHVMMNPSFITAALAIKVQEGIALAMDPTVTIPSIAIPIILKSKTNKMFSDIKNVISSNVSLLSSSFIPASTTPTTTTTTTTTKASSSS